MKEEILAIIREKGECDTMTICAKLDMTDFNGWIETRKQLDELVRSGSLKIRYHDKHAYFSVVNY